MAIDARGIWKISKPMLAGLWRLVSAAALAYLFILVLITASLQASVAERLGRLQPPMDFSTGYSTWRDAQDMQQQIMRLGRDVDNAERAERDALAEWYKEMGPLSSIQRRLQTVPGCEFRASLTGEVDADGLLADLRACLDQGEIDARLRQAGADVLDRSGAISQAGRTVMEATHERMRLRVQLDEARGSAIAPLPLPSTADEAEAAVRAAAAAATARAAAGEAATQAFRELDAFGKDRRLIGASLLADFPPAVVHILLAFVSGMFGALLVTLVLVVYPGNALKLSTGGGGYEARIFLGGLISICLFVVLGGGTAVLGTSGGFGDGDANFLAFCAIGILAGMFSDRVAQWLSGRADAFFSRERQQPE